MPEQENSDKRGRVDQPGGTDQHGILGDEELRKVIGNFPLSALAAFPDSGSPTT